MLSAYSALNFGHRHPELIAAAKEQLDRLTLTSRAFHNDQMGPFLRDLADLCGMDMALPMNTGAEAVETALKTARKWGYEVKGVTPDRAKVIVCSGNFHGRTITIVSFSTDEDSRNGLRAVHAGVRGRPVRRRGRARGRDRRRDRGLPRRARSRARRAWSSRPTVTWRERASSAPSAACCSSPTRSRSGLGRTGTTFACELEGIRPDVFILGKALGGGIVPVSAVVADDDVLGVFEPGQHGSTFGGNPVASAIGRRVVAMLRTGELQERSAKLGEYLLQEIRGAEPRHRRRGQGPRAVDRDRARRLGRHRASLGGTAARGRGPGQGHA